MKKEQAQTGNKVMRHFRFSPAMVQALDREAERTHRTRTRILELAFSKLMAVKAGERDRAIIS
jgi:predicted transcriptional regulator